MGCIHYRAETTEVAANSNWKRAELGSRGGWHRSEVIVDYVSAMESAADEAWQRAAGDFESDSFFEGVRVAFVEFRWSRVAPQIVDGLSPFEQGRKQAWAIMAAVALGADIGLDPPPVLLPEVSQPDRRLGPGWIGILGETTVREGVFDASDTPTFHWREAGAGPEASFERSARSQRLAWSEVTWVRLRPLSSLLAVVAEFHPPTPAMDPNVVYGALQGPNGPETEVFGLLGTPVCPGPRWLEMFRVAGVQIKE